MLAGVAFVIKVSVFLVINHIRMSHGLNSLKGNYMGDYIGDYCRGYLGGC